MPGRTLQYRIVLSLVLAFLIAGCQPAAPVQPTPSPEAADPLPTAPTATAPETAPGEVPQTQPVSPTPDSDPLAACPKEEPGKYLYVSEYNGFCFLYPDGFIIEPDELRPNDGVKLVGPRETEKVKSMVRAGVFVWVMYNGPADFSDSAAYAKTWRERNQVNMGPAELSEENTIIGGQPATVLSGLPGMILQQVGFAVANGHKYTLTISPMPGFVPELDEAVRRGWDTVAASLVFFPPTLPREFTRSQDVCPEPAEGTQLLVNELEGFCFLYPVDFAPAPEYVGRIVGGPNLGNWEGFENVQPSLTVASFPQIAEQVPDNPRDLLADRLEVDLSSVQDRTFGGARAVVFMHNPQGGPWASRQAIAILNQRVTTIVSDPWEPERWPEAMPFVENAWETVTNSLTFFSPWH